MSKTVKQMILRDYDARLGDAKDVLLINIRGVNAIGTTKLRSKLRKKNIRVSVVRNSLFRRRSTGTGLEALVPLLVGPTAVAFGGNSVVEVAREIVELLKEFPGIELKGAMLDGQVFSGDDGVKRLSKFPTREEAIAQSVSLVLSPGRKLASSILGPGRTVASLVKAVETKLEKGEAIAKVG